jgi:phosphate transport system protein
MRNVYQRELGDIQHRLVEVSEFVAVSITYATRAFAESNLSLAEVVIDRVGLVEQKVRELDSLVIDVMARQQPVASDLRLMVGSLRMSASLERMADLAEHIGQLSRYRYPESAIPKGLQKTFLRMGQLDIHMAEKLTTLLRTLDAAAVTEIRNLDDELDELHSRVFEKVLSEKMFGNTTGVVDATLASRYHERFGDHVVNVAKQVMFFLSGELD